MIMYWQTIDDPKYYKLDLIEIIESDNPLNGMLGTLLMCNCSLLLQLKAEYSCSQREFENENTDNLEVLPVTMQKAKIQHATDSPYLSLDGF